MIKYTRDTAADVADAVDEMRLCMKDYSPDILTKACLSIVIMMQKPTIGLTELLDTIKGTSEYIALSLMDVSPTVN